MSRAVSPEGGGTVNKYELLFIFDPDVDEETRASFIERIKGIIQEDG